MNSSHSIAASAVLNVKQKLLANLASLADDKTPNGSESHGNMVAALWRIRRYAGARQRLRPGIEVQPYASCGFRSATHWVECNTAVLFNGALRLAQRSAGWQVPFLVFHSSRIKPFSRTSATHSP